MRAQPSAELVYQRPVEESGCVNTVLNSCCVLGWGVMLQPSGEGGQHWQLADRFEVQLGPQVGEEWEQCCGGSDGVGLEEHGGVVDGNGSAVLAQCLSKLMILALNDGPMCQCGLLMLWSR